MLRWYSALLMLSHLLHAEGPWLGGGSPVQTIWDGKGGQILSHRYGQARLEWLQAKGNPRTILVPQDPSTRVSNLAYYQGRMIIVRSEAKGAGPGLFSNPASILESLDGMHWRRILDWRPKEDQDSGTILQAFALDSGKYLLIGRFRQAGAGLPSWLAVGKGDAKGVLRIHELIPPEVGLEKSPIGQKTGQKFFNQEAHFPLRGLLGGQWVIETDAAIALVDDFTGRFFLFDRKGRFRGTSSVVPGWESKAEGASAEAHDAVILAAAPDRDGSILIATRSREAIEKGMKEYPRSYHHAKEFTPENRRAVEASIQAYPHLEWYRLDPEKGRIRPVPAPQGVPKLFLDSRELSQFRFHFKLDGNLEVFGFEGRK